MATSFEEHLQQDVRLVILRSLNEQVAGTLNEALLHAALETYGHMRSREFVRQQLRVLQDVGAITLREAGPVMIATLTRSGLDHVERRTVIEGVKRPSPEV